MAGGDIFNRPVVQPNEALLILLRRAPIATLLRM